ncbi:MAG: nucleotidyltransferase family protein [Candidatus Woesearchaeota archaeon]
MKGIILAAGYATRLFPLTENFPKPLIPINGKPMIDYIIQKIEDLGVTQVHVVTNSRFYEHFVKWAEQYSGKADITVVNDNTTSNDDRLGAIGDIQYTIEQGNIDDDIVVVGGDNLFKFTLHKAYELFTEKQKSTIVAYDVKDLELAKKYGVIEIDADNKVVSFEEKPPEPKSTLCAICVYFYPKSILPRIKEYLDAGNNKDAPGNLPAWLVKNDVVYGIGYDEQWYDIGGFESLQEAKESYGEENVDIEKLKQGNI